MTLGTIFTSKRRHNSSEDTSIWSQGSPFMEGLTIDSHVIMMLIVGDLHNKYVLNNPLKNFQAEKLLTMSV